MLSATTFFYQDHLTWCVPAARQYPEWRNFWLRMSPEVYISFFVLLYWVTVCMFVLLRQGAPPHTCVDFHKVNLQTLAFAIGQSASFQSTNTRAAIFYGILLFFSVFAIPMFNTFLLIVLLKPRYMRNITSIDLATSNNFQFTGTNTSLLSIYLKYNEVD